MSKVYFEKVSYITELLASGQYSQVFVLVDENSKEYCYPILKEYLEPHKLIEISSGERNKTLSSCNLVWSALTNATADRKTLLINLGGGVITDMGGFCAGTYKRGIRFINIPTTLLSQVDASVGAKTGIDFQGYKNHIGLFCEAEAVLVDSVFHDTLPQKQLISGYAEMLKHGLIANQKHWQACLDNGSNSFGNEIIQQSVAIKEEVVKADPTEKGLRKILNFGHTIGHAIESHLLGTSSELLHGEAIGIGMIAEAYISKYKGLLAESEFQIIVEELRKIYSSPKIEKASLNNIKRLCKQDKKNENGNLNMSLLQNIGTAVYDIPVEEEVIDQALAEIL
ncbi:3-dehydroquinate synthase [uncultured Marivirga sp.]|uniref:3-dehydroquinate synthase n=1 Tax=uncultured Marivirga sp. TaxID=1123707 RepID=UPI0030EB582C|tara:strand:+ start:22362 stop:23378 length:1017 start_codon:yes stop_codon:yes gene_type:complete